MAGRRRLAARDSGHLAVAVPVRMGYVARRSRECDFRNRRPLTAYACTVTIGRYPRLKGRTQ